MALRDAVVAANHLVPPLRGRASDAALDAAAEAVAVERLPEICAVQAMQTRSGAQLSHPKPWMMRLLPWLMKLGLSPARLNRDREKLRYGLSELRLEV